MKWIVALLALGLALVQAVDWDVETDLDRYVHFDDGYYSYEELDSYRYDNLSATVYIYNMTSQKWMDESLVSKSVWWHMVGIAIPDEIKDLERAWAFTEGGSNRESTEPPPFDDPFCTLSAALSTNTGLIGGFILQNPNSPIVFADDPTQRSRSEDRLIAWTWRSYLNNPDPDINIVARMPMTKSHKRGLDIIRDVAKEKVPETNIDKFIVTGASKRGWTAMSLAATDQRVDYCIPIVFTLLNMKKNMVHHNQAMDGDWSFALAPYWDENITQEVQNPKMDEVFFAEDMFNYKERLTMPKLFILATGDEFFFPQDLHAWWDDIPEPKHLMYNPNTQHILFPFYGRILETLTSAIILHVQGASLPDITWERTHTEEGAFIHVWTNPPPVEMNISRAETLEKNTRRDFRLIEGYPEQNLHPVRWHWDLPEDLGDGEYEYYEDNPENGEWLGFLFYGLWDGPEGRRLYLTTEVEITPDTYPRESCSDAESCYGGLA